jgi:hypothetical protein
MAVYPVGQKQEFLGLSTDTRPVLTVAKTGSTFTEIDTGMKYVWVGSGWVEDLTMYHAVKMALEEAT